MKKNLITLALVAAGMVADTSDFAQSADNAGWFVNGNVGRTSIDKGPYNDSDTGYAFGTGYRWGLTPSVALGFEAGYNDLGNIKVSNVFTSDPVLAKERSALRGWTAGINGHFNVTPNWYISARTGVYGWRGHGLSNNDNPLRKSVSKTDFYGGAGVGYDFSNNWSLGVNYDYFDAKKSQVNLSTDMLSVSTEYRF